jgi:hypothetical protein
VVTARPAHRRSPTGLRGLLRGLHEHDVEYVLFGAIGMHKGANATVLSPLGAELSEIDGTEAPVLNGRRRRPLSLRLPQ